MKNTSTRILLLFLVISCDYQESADFTITNNSSQEVVIKTISDGYDRGFNFLDSMHIIPAGEAMIFYQGLGLTGKNVIPIDVYAPLDSIPPATRFDIYVGNQLYDTLRLRQFWEFHAVERASLYRLTITNELLDGL